MSEPHVGSRGAQSNGIGRSTRRATCIKPQDYDRKARRGCGPVQRAARAGRRPRLRTARLSSARLRLRVNKPARCLGVRRSEGRGGFTQSCPPRLLPPVHPSSPPPSGSLPESITSPVGFMSITSKSGFLNQLPSGRCENVALQRWKVQTVCVREAPAAAWFPWQPAAFDSVATPFGSVTPVQLFQPESAAPSLKMHYDAGSHS